MPNIEKYENLVLGSGGSGKFIAWTMTGAGRRTAMIERRAIGGACPNVACLPSKNIIYSAKVISLARRGTEFGLKTGALSVDMQTVQRRKRLMVEGLRQMHLDATTNLSRAVAERGIYPAVDPLASFSRILDPHVVGQEHYDTARQVKVILQRYRDLQDIIAILGIDELSDEDKLTVSRIGT